MAEENSLDIVVKQQVDANLDKQKDPKTLGRDLQNRAANQVSRNASEELSLNLDAEYIKVDCLDNVYKVLEFALVITKEGREAVLKDLANISIEAIVLVDKLKSFYGIEISLDTFGGKDKLVKVSEIPNIPGVDYIFSPAKTSRDSHQRAKNEWNKFYQAIKGDCLIPQDVAGRILEMSLNAAIQDPEKDLDIQTSRRQLLSKINLIEKDIVEGDKKIQDEADRLGISVEEFLSQNPDLVTAREGLEQNLQESKDGLDSLSVTVQERREQNKELREKAFALLASCPRSKADLTNAFFEEVEIKASPTEREREAPLHRYVGEAIETRRPAGSFLIVELVDSNGNRKTVKGANNQEVSSLMLNMMPDTFSINSAKIINRYKTLNRWVEEHWGDELDQISFSGSTFAFMDFKEGRGLTVYDRELTAPYKELRHLAAIYQTNGIQYQSPNIIKDRGDAPVGAPIIFEEEPRSFFTTNNSRNIVYLKRHPRAGLVRDRLRVRITHDWFQVWGMFDSFDVVEDASSPFRLTYSCNFTAEKVVWY